MRSKISAMKTKKNVWRDSGDVYSLFKIMKTFGEKGQRQKEGKKFYITGLTSKVESSLLRVFELPIHLSVCCVTV